MRQHRDSVRNECEIICWFQSAGFNSEDGSPADLLDSKGIITWDWV